MPGRTRMRPPQLAHSRRPQHPARGPAPPAAARNATPPVLVEAALSSKAGKDGAARGSFLTATGALSVRSGAKTGRSPKDKRVVDEPGSRDNVWWGPVNIPLTQNAFMVNRGAPARRLYAACPHRRAPTRRWSGEESSHPSSRLEASERKGLPSRPNLQRARFWVFFGQIYQLIENSPVQPCG